MPDLDTFSLKLVLTTAGAAMGGAFIAAIMQLIKGVLPAEMQTGRAVLFIVYALAALLVIGAVLDTGLALSAGTIFIGVLAWQGVAAAAVGSYEVVAKASRAVAGTTNKSGPDR